MNSSEVENQSRRPGKASTGMVLITIIPVGVICAFLAGLFWFGGRKSTPQPEKFDLSPPTVSAKKLSQEFLNNPDTAIAKYAGKRYVVIGEAFGAFWMDPDVVTGLPQSSVRLTLGTGDASDMGSDFMLLISDAAAATALAEVRTGDHIAVNCKVFYLVHSEGNHGKPVLGGDDCNSVLTGLNEKPKSPFAE